MVSHNTVQMQKSVVELDKQIKSSSIERLMLMATKPLNTCMVTVGLVPLGNNLIWKKCVVISKIDYHQGASALWDGDLNYSPIVVLAAQTTHTQIR